MKHINRIAILADNQREHIQGVDSVDDITSPASLSKSKQSRAEPRDPLQNETDVGLIALAKGGNLQAMENLFVRQAPLVRPFVKALLPSWQRIASEDDLLQDTFAYSASRFRLFRGNAGEELTAWHKKIADHKVKDFVRYLKRDCRPDGNERLSLDMFVEILTAGKTPPHEALAKKEVREILELELSRLQPEDYGLVLKLRFLEELEIKEIAERMARKDEAAVHLLIFRALSKLRERFRNGGPLTWRRK